MAINNFINKIVKDPNSMAIGHCKDLDVIVTDNNTQSPKLNITYKDPDVEGVPYGGTKIVINSDSLPVNPDDGIIIKDIMTKNNHSTTPLVIDLPIDKYSLTKNIYTKLFPYASNGVHNLLGKENDVKEITWTRKNHK